MNEILNLNDEQDENQKEILKFQLTSSNIEIPFIDLFKFSQFIQDEYLGHDIINQTTLKLQNLQKDQQVKEKNIILFFKLLQGKSVTIRSDQYCDLCTLSESFKVNSLQNWLKKYLKRHSRDINFIIDLLIEKQLKKCEDISLNDQFSAEMENCLKENIKECLKNPKFGGLNQSNLYRIIEKSDKKEISSSLLYDFISG